MRVQAMQNVPYACFPSINKIQIQLWLKAKIASSSLLKDIYTLGQQAQCLINSGRPAYFEIETTAMYLELAILDVWTIELLSP